MWHTQTYTLEHPYVPTVIPTVGPVDFPILIVEDSPLKFTWHTSLYQPSEEGLIPFFNRFDF